MSNQSRVFIGLLRPPKGLAWPALWKAADWDPNFLDVLVTTLQETPPTTNRKLHGGDSYAP